MKRTSALSMTISLLTLLVGMHKPLAASSPSSSFENEVGSWQPLINQPQFIAADGVSPGGAANLWLMTDGTVITLNQGPYYGSTEVWKFTPDSFGNYVNGTWSQIASFPDYNGAPFSPQASASAVLADGRLILAGGESNAAGLNDGYGYYPQIEAAQIALYDPIANAWTTIIPPVWAQANPHIWGFFNLPFQESNPSSSLGVSPFIGDAASVVLEDGTFMIGPSWSELSAKLDPQTLLWTPTGWNKNATNHEEGWTLLPNGKVLVVDLYVGEEIPTPPSKQVGSELYNPCTDNWEKGPDLVRPIQHSLYITGWGNSGSYTWTDHEVGPTCLRPDGTVICFSGSATGITGIYDTKKEKWNQGPTMPFIADVGQLSVPDGPCALLPNGNVLVTCSPFTDYTGGQAPTYIFELTKDNRYVQEPIFPNAVNESPAGIKFLTLPTGQVMSADGSLDVEIYTPANQNYKKNWASIIKEYPHNVSPGSTYKISGIRFNGMSQGGVYGDDFQNATNWPLVRITNKETGHVFYCRSHDHSFMGVASDRKVYTYFDVPSNIDLGKSKIEVVCNGIPSKAKYITVN